MMSPPHRVNIIDALYSLVYNVLMSLNRKEHKHFVMASGTEQTTGTNYSN